MLGDRQTGQRPPAVRTRPTCAPRKFDPALKQKLVGAPLPAVELVASPGRRFSLGDLGLGWAVIYLYPGSPAQVEADAAEHRAFGDLEDEFSQRGVKIAGLSTQTPREQEALVARERICHLMLADPGLTLARTLKVLSLVSGAEVTYRRITLVCKGLTIRAVLPVSEPTRAAAQVDAWITLTREA